jgi:hypothetical protein
MPKILGKAFRIYGNFHPPMPPAVYRVPSSSPILICKGKIKKKDLIDFPDEKIFTTLSNYNENEGFSADLPPGIYTLLMKLDWRIFPGGYVKEGPEEYCTYVTIDEKNNVYVELCDEGLRL